MTIALPTGGERRIRQQSRIPDLMVLTPQGAQQIAGKPSGLSLHHDNPMLIVEIVSQSNADDDYIDKRSQYESRGIAEYWIVDCHQQQVVVFILEGSTYVETRYKSSEPIESLAFPDIRLTADKIFTEVSSFE